MSTETASRDRGRGSFTCANGCQPDGACHGHTFRLYFSTRLGGHYSVIDEGCGNHLWRDPNLTKAWRQMAYGEGEQRVN